MAYSLANKPPDAQENWRAFNPGDSILKSTTRMAVIYELLQLIINAITEYNTSNVNQISQFALSNDGDQGAFTSSGSIPFKVLPVPVDGRDYESINNIADYLEWNVPTTGELAGFKNAYDALIHCFEQVNRLNDIIKVGGLINSASGLTTLDKSGAQKEHTFTVGVQTVAVVTATGSVANVIQEHGIIADMQNGLFA